MPAATPARHASPLAAPSARGKSKLLTVALAFLFGSLGAHRFYLGGLRDLYGWAHLLALLAGAIGVASMATGAGSPALNWTFAVAGGISVISAFLAAIVYGLRPDDKWDARFNPHGKPTRSGWPVVILVILSLLIGTGLLMAGLAISFQTFFESQVEAARELSQ
ncbi:NINE protein [Cupriavidus alkaliphilus]|uniref:NINE protein n=1 Tax=Cupriavidus alkaliphilus TaxID=942866 RepID=UPI000DC36BA5|nr:NINE protein [Cupriavidus alkaliphilus]MBB3013473.1 TM2 domain-containing membrane protein YozV [Cupriavidus alkaliphilus]RAS12071.1 TM2 domain-containing membrane protein YozV [Cupriavidus alkaliphilus]